MATLIDATNVKHKIETYVSQYIEEHVKPEDREISLLIIKAGDDMASDRYVSMKQKACERVGIKCDVMPFEENITQEWLEEYILNVQDNYTSVMVQAPVYKHLDFDRLCSAISPEKDADGLNPINQGLLYDGSHMGIRPCTALGVAFLLEEHEIDVKGKVVTIIGRGKLVADPLAKMLEHKGATVVKIHTQTDLVYKQLLVQHSDIIVSCVGRDMGSLLNPMECMNVEAIIGVGFRYEDGRQVQDFDIEEFKAHTKCTPNTKGTGMATISALLMNIITCDKATKFISMEETNCGER
jgi:methylenetetrahydrofolate dehydrogenase (NADP+)/methenyltetrahydrofolate cyclohydrolase